MKKYLTVNKLVSHREEVIWFLIWFTLPLSIWYNSLAIILGVLVILTGSKSKRHNATQSLYLLVPILLFIIALTGVFDRLLVPETYKELEQLLPLLVIPILFYFGTIKLNSFTQVSLTGLVVSLFLAGIIMISESAFQIFETGSIDKLYYHNLSQPFSLGAIYFSFYYLITLLQIDELSWLTKRKYLQIAVVGFFLVMLFLLASKLLIITGVFAIVLKYRKLILYQLPRRKLLIPISVLLFALLLIPASMRIKELANPNFDIVYAKTYQYDSPLNGLNLRLIQWRLGLEIIEENNAWISGVGIDKSQELLNSKYLEYGIYTGYEGTDDTGYLNYNFHNQFIEEIVRTGLIGVTILLIMFIVLLATPVDFRFVSNWVIFIVFMFFLTESVLERQQGIVYFCLIYSSYFPKNKR